MDSSVSDENRRNITRSDDLRTQFSESEKAVGRLTAGAEMVRSIMADIK